MGTSIRSGLGRFSAKDFHCCSKKEWIKHFVFVEIVAGCQRSSWGTSRLKRVKKQRGVLDLMLEVLEGNG
jgi:hypothetical protein